MSRIAKKPIMIPSGVKITLQGHQVDVKGLKGTLSFVTHESVKPVLEGEALIFEINREDPVSKMHGGTARACIANMVMGVSVGFERKLQLVGVGYRAKATGSSLNLTLGFSHPVDHLLPAGVTVETPTQTEIVLKSIDKALLGQVAADIRAYRPPEPYKGKGIRYSDEVIHLKETKKK